MADKRYVVGIDVGLNSVGLAAIELDDDPFGYPIRVLNMQSVIHDGGIDPTQNKSQTTRKNISGVARRMRRLQRRNHARLRKLDELLERYGYPIVPNEELRGYFDPWYARAQACDGYIADDAERLENVSIALRHIARHRGWRNPYNRVESLKGEWEPSPFFAELKQNCEATLGESLPDTFTASQLVVSVLDASDGPSPRLRTQVQPSGTVVKKGLLPQKLFQSDNAYEVQQIFEAQQVAPAQAAELFDALFHQVSPRGSAQGRVGIDPLTGEPRALKASLAFQRYRIASTLCNLRIAEGGAKRALSVDEKARLYDLLADEENKDEITWLDIAEELGIERNDLKGVGELDDDGERISNRPPRIDVYQKFAKLKTPTKKAFQEWWQAHENAERETLIEILSNTVNIDDVYEDPRYSSVIDLVEGLSEEQLPELDSVVLQSGRAAYSPTTLDALAEAMLTTEDDLHAARKRLFGVGDDWQPPVPPIGEPLGNPAVDRVLKIVNRFLMNAQERWGKPESVNIEHVRGGFTSVKMAKDFDSENQRRFEKHREYRRALEDSGISVTGANIRRIEAVQRQNCQCLYCGAMITFETAEMDHIVPRKGVGSTNTRTNLAAVCVPCNRAKSAKLFSSFAKTSYAKEHGISVKAACERAGQFFTTPSEGMRSPYGMKQEKNFIRAVQARLRQTTEDEAIDSRSIESVAWMADELHKRINQHLYGNEGLSGERKVFVFRGAITSEARKASGIDGKLALIGGKAKVRFDRRHHAVDAAVVACLRPSVAQVLAIRQNLRESQQLYGIHSAGEEEWKDYRGGDPALRTLYTKWLNRSEVLCELVNDALAHNRVPVTQAVRMKFGNSVAHDATIHTLRRITVGSAIDAETIRRASTPALHAALTRLPDYSATDGLPEDSQRTIRIHDRYLNAQEEVEFFTSTAAQVRVRGGSADVGSAIHHARIYRYYTVLKSGKKKVGVGMVRVFQADLLHHKHADLFTVPLSPHGLSLRYADPKVARALLEGRAEYLGYLVEGDEIQLDVSPETLKGQVGEATRILREIHPDGAEVMKRWVVSGFYTSLQLRLRPRLLSGEGLQQLHVGRDEAEALGKIIEMPGWRPTVSVIATLGVRVIRRNAFGEERWTSRSGLPISYRWELSE